MSRRDLAIVIVVALGVNSVVALLTTTPGDSVDAHYALAGGTLIASGEGFTAPYFWNYVNPPTDLPAPSYRYWQPLSALLSAIGIVVLGDLLPPFGAAQAVYVLAGSLVPVLAALTAARLGEPRHGLIAGLLAAFSGIYAVYWSIPETFTPFALGAGLALLCTIVAREDGPSWIWLVAGLGAGIGHLARADGLLLLGVVGLFALLPHREEPVRRRVLFGALVTGGYLLVMGPWFARNIMVFGSWQAPGGLSTLWIAEYNQIFDFPAVITPSTLFEQGVGPPLLARVEALARNVALFILGHNLVVLTPLTLAAWWKHRARFAPVLLYAVLLFTAMTAAFALQGMRGGWLHSGAALVPFVMAGAALALDDLARWLARQQRVRFNEALRFVQVAAVAFTALITTATVAIFIVGPDDLTTIAWNNAHPHYDWAGEYITMGDAVVMVNNPPAFYNHTGLSAIPLVNGDETALLRAADAYGADYVLLDENLPADLWPLYLDGPQSGRLTVLAEEAISAQSIRLYRVLPQE